MDSFAVDLDRVLDDFERKEGAALTDVPAYFTQNINKSKFGEEFHYSVEKTVSKSDVQSCKVFDELSDIDRESFNSKTASCSYIENESDMGDNEALLHSDKWNTSRLDDKDNIDFDEGYFVPEGIKADRCKNSALDVHTNLMKKNSSNSPSVDSMEYENEVQEHELFETEITGQISDKKIRPSFMSCSPTETYNHENIFPCTRSTGENICRLDNKCVEVFFDNDVNASQNSVSIKNTILENKKKYIDVDEGSGFDPLDLTTSNNSLSNFQDVTNSYACEVTFKSDVIVNNEVCENEMSVTGPFSVESYNDNIYNSIKIGKDFLDSHNEIIAAEVGRDLLQIEDDKCVTILNLDKNDIGNGSNFTKNSESHCKSVKSEHSFGAISNGNSSETLSSSSESSEVLKEIRNKNDLCELPIISARPKEKIASALGCVDRPQSLIGLTTPDITKISPEHQSKSVENDVEVMNEIKIYSNTMEENRSERILNNNDLQKEENADITDSLSVQGSLEMPAGLTHSPVHPTGMIPPPLSSSNPLFSITDLGKRPPMWIPDADAPNCMQCDGKFTFTKRRHHCRACGKIFCNTCCNLRSKLEYLEFKEGRVCSKCYQDLIRAQVFERMESSSNQSLSDCNARNYRNMMAYDQDTVTSNKNQDPIPNNLNEYCSATSVLQQYEVSGNSSPTARGPLTVMVPAGVLRKEGALRKDNRESKQVVFSDGTRPGRDYTENSDNSLQTCDIMLDNEKTSSCNQYGILKVKSIKSDIIHYIPKEGLPPVLLGMGDDGEIVKEEAADVQHTMVQIERDDESGPVHFVINKNLIILVKLVTLDCCLNKVCVCFASRGLCTVGQSEILIVLEWQKEEKILPLDIFRYFQFIYEEASIGNIVTSMDCTIFALQCDENISAYQYLNNPFLGSQDNGGFLYITPTFQCLNKLVLPEQPYLCAVLLQKWELPWAKVFPLRLMLRLGAEFRYYPCPLISIRQRKPVFGEIGHTIMNLLVDFRNYQYTIPKVHGFTIEMKARKTFLNFPRNRYQEVANVLSSGNEHVIAVGATFSTCADSYLVCIQNEEGNYQTQAINIQNTERKVTGAGFVVFNGALKSNMDFAAKSTIVEDGLMIQVLPEMILKVRDALTNMKDLSIPCGTNSLEGNERNTTEEEVVIHWIAEERNLNIGEKSPIDGISLEGVDNIHIHNVQYHEGPRNKAVRWVKVFFLDTNEDQSSLEPVDLSRLAETLAKATCVALAPLTSNLHEANLKKIGLRTNINNEAVGYQAGSMGQKLPDACMKNLDNELVPVIHNAASQNRHCIVALELIFYIINI